MNQLVRIIAHWTGGADRAGAEDRQHYHFLVEGDGSIVAGKEDPADNIVTSDGDYAAHTLNLNKGSIGIAVCGMHGAVEQPFDPGAYPITERQFRAFAILIADLCRRYSIRVTDRTVLTHAEVQHTLGVRQKGKWDIARLPWRNDLIGSKAVGDHLRSLVIEALGMPLLQTGGRAILSMGATGREVRDMQEQLTALGYQPGAADGIFGSGTRAALLAFQADNGLVTDGVAGPQTWTALFQAGKARAVNPMAEARADTTVKDMRAKGSETIAAADRAQAGITVGTVVAGGGALLDSLTADPVGTISDVAGKVDQVGSLPVIARLASWAADHWWIILAAAAAIYGLAYMQRVKERRVADHASGANRGR